MKPKVFLRADGSHEIGMGHVVRTLALGKAISSDFNCTFFTSEGTSINRKELERYNINYGELPRENHFQAFFDHLDGDEIIVLDNYFFGSSYQERLKEIGCTLVSVDDLHEGHFFSDIIINYSPSAKISDYSYESYSKLLVGLDYVLLRSEIFSHVRNAQIEPNGDYILICFGGSDFYNLSEKYLREIKTHIPDIEVRVIIGGAYRHTSQLKKVADNHSNVAIHQNLSVHEMIQVISECKLAIVSASTIMLEVIAMRKPFLSGYYADNQIEIGNSFKNYDFCEIVGDLRKYSLSSSILEDLLGKEVPQLIDGFSHSRIKSELNKLIM